MIRRGSHVFTSVLQQQGLIIALSFIPSIPLSITIVIIYSSTPFPSLAALDPSSPPPTSSLMTMAIQSNPNTDPSPPPRSQRLANVQVQTVYSTATGSDRQGIKTNQPLRTLEEE